MGETFWEKWKHRVRGAWRVLMGRAYAGEYPDMTELDWWKSTGPMAPEYDEIVRENFPEAEQRHV